MGYLRHECLVVSGWDAERVCKAHEAATAIFNPAGLGSLVGGLTQHAINGGAAFMISPDGSKEGWHDSDKAAAARNEFMEWLRSSEAKELYLDWALVLIGGDDCEYRVLQSPNGEEAESWKAVAESYENDRLEQKAEIEKLRTALKPFADIALYNDRNGYINPPIYTHDVRVAKAALAADQQTAKTEG